jgi:hypothetical protein
MRSAAVAALIALTGCGDNLEDFARDEQCNPLPTAPAGADIGDRLRALPGVTAVELPARWPGYRYFDMTIDQPVDHDDPCRQRFTQHMSLIHRGDAAPMVLVSTGYGDYFKDFPYEPPALLAANQIVLEHRYFKPSRPVPADWDFLDIRQAAGDHHRVIAALRDLYPAPWLTTGGSKGGMTTLFHARFYPDDDIQGRVPYVAPINLGAPDDRYDAFLDTVGTAECRAAVQAVQVEMLARRRAALEERAREQARSEHLDYDRVAIGPAVESAIAGIEWSFWQYHGVGACAQVPAVGASDDAMWAFLDAVSPASDLTDDRIAFFDAYTYQAVGQLGYPGVTDAHLDAGLFRYDGSDYDTWPRGAPVPDFDPGAMRDIVDWIATDGDRILAVYGAWDPWTAGMIELGAATESFRFVAPEGTHGAGLTDLVPADRDAAFAALDAWSGVAPDASRLDTARRVPTYPDVRVPPWVVRRASGR